MTRTVPGFFAVLAATSVVIGFAGVVEGGIPNDPPARRAVHYSDLDLDRSADAGRLYARITRAAGQVCRHSVDHLSARAQAALSKCVKTAVADAVDRVGHPNLTAVHAARLGRAAATVAARR